MTTRCDTCEHDDITPLTAWRFLRRGLLGAAVVSAVIAIVLGEAWVIEQAPALFASDVAVPTVEPVGRSIDVLSSDAIPIAVLH
ncbi:MAG: hypothetical protein M3R31_12830 [Pseudomonadota bacterium]|nr:hypothetical protein [Pseudomonadota bacterium]